MERRLKVAFAIVFLALLISAAWLLFNTETGKRIQQDPKLLADDVRSLVAHHPYAAPAGLVGLYVLLASLGLLPIWWLQIWAGIAFGIWWGVFWCLIAATISAVIGMLLSRWFAADWFHRKIESKMERLQKLDSILGHNGLLLVMTLRLAHILPFGLSNYALGLIKVSVVDMLIGTFLGSIPAVSLSVGIGAGYRPHDWRFVVTLVSINVLLLSPLAIRYLKPKWFRKIGVE